MNTIRHLVCTMKLLNTGEIAKEKANIITLVFVFFFPREIEECRSVKVMNESRR